MVHVNDMNKVAEMINHVSKVRKEVYTNKEDVKSFKKEEDESKGSGKEAEEDVQKTADGCEINNIFQSSDYRGMMQ